MDKKVAKPLHSSSILVAPTEPPALIRALGGATSSVPERLGVDVLWRARGCWFGVQRKELKDLLASVADGRLGKELGQMEDVRRGGGWTCLVVEGVPTFTSEGQLVMHSWGGLGKRFTQEAWWSLQMSVMASGCGFVVERDMGGLAQRVLAMKAWSEKKHRLANTRPKDVAQDSWGGKGNKHWGSWFLQGIPGVGADRAGAIIEHFGRVPMKLDVEVAELKKVKGLGDKTIEAIVRAVG